MTEYLDKSMRPLAGQCFVEVESMFSLVEGGIYIPEIGRDRRSRTGKCMDMRPYQDGKMYRMLDEKKSRKAGRTVWKYENAARWNDIYADLVGKYVVYQTGKMVQLDKDLYIDVVRLEHVLAISDESLSGGQREVERCRWCPSQGESNIILGPDGYCIHCGRNAKGQYKKDKQITVSDDEKERFGKTADEYMQERRPDRPAEKPERVITYPGMDKRS